MQRFTSQNPFIFLASGGGGYGMNIFGSFLSDTAKNWQQWLGNFAEIGGAIVILFSLICGFFSVSAAVGKRIQWMREGQSLFQVLFTDGKSRPKKTKNKQQQNP
jgi:hypothetical protein